MKLQDTNYHGFDHQAVNKMFSGELTYVNTFQLLGKGDEPWAVYHAAKPNREKGHKEFMLLKTTFLLLHDKPRGLVSGIEKKELNKHRYQSGIHCKNCDEVIFSQHRHDYHSCSCKVKSKRVWVDGGKDYLRLAWGNKADFQQVRIDLIKGTAKVIKDKKKRKK